MAGGVVACQYKLLAHYSPGNADCFGGTVFIADDQSASVLRETESGIPADAVFGGFSNQFSIFVESLIVESG